MPLLAVTHPGLFDNDYGEHCMLLAEQLRRLNHPPADAIQVVAVPHELKPARDFLLSLPEHLHGRSLLVHVGAWRELHEGQPVNTMAKDLMEVTLRLRRPVVPIRISGGLPAQSLGYKFHLPYRMSRLAIHMAPSIEADALAGLGPLDPRRRAGGDQRNGAAVRHRCRAGEQHAAETMPAPACGDRVLGTEMLPDGGGGNDGGPIGGDRGAARVHPQWRAAERRCGGSGMVRAAGDVDQRRAGVEDGVGLHEPLNISCNVKDPDLHPFIWLFTCLGN